MATILDPSPFTNGWIGTNDDDVLIYSGGFDAVDGLSGYDTLNIPQYSYDSIIGTYSNSIVSIITPDLILSYVTNTINAIGVEQLKFLDKYVVLEPYQERITIPWGSSGYWTKSKGFGQREGWFSKGRGASKKYLIDDTYEVLTAEDIGDKPLALSGGDWSSVYFVEDFGGTYIYSGKNVIAFFDGLTQDQALNLPII